MIQKGFINFENLKIQAKLDIAHTCRVHLQKKIKNNKKPPKKCSLLQKKWPPNNVLKFK